MSRLNLRILVFGLSVFLWMKTVQGDNKSPALVLKKVEIIAHKESEGPGDYVCQQIMAPIKIDGDLSDWSGISPISLALENPSDLSAHLYLAWDMMNLYLGADVTDDILDQDQEVSRFRRGDCVSLVLDILNDAQVSDARAIHSRDNYEYYLGLSEKFGSVAVLERARARTQRRLDREVEVVALKKADGNGYILEAAFPLKLLQPLAPLAQKYCGFGIGVVDFDGKNDRQWVSLSGSRPEYFGDLVFQSNVKAIKTVNGELYIPERLLDINQDVKAFLSIASAEARYGLQLGAAVLKDGQEIISVSNTVDLKPGVNDFELLWNTQDLIESQYRFSVWLKDKSGIILWDTLSSPLVSRLLAQLQTLDAYGGKFRVENVIKQIKKVPYDKEKGFSFVVLGDTRNYPGITKYLYRDINRRKPLFSVILGDLTRRGFVEELHQYLPFLSNSTSPVLLVIGNHDRGNDKREYVRTFGSLDYYFDYGNARFIALDNSEGVLTDEQLSWAEKRLAETTTKRKFVFLHMPPKTIKKWAWHSFDHGDEKLVQLMTKYGIDHVFIGHIHTYSTAIVEGVPYTVTGGGGAPLYRGYGPEGEKYHFVVVDVTKDGIKCKRVKLEWVETPAANEYAEPTVREGLRP